MLTHNYTDTTWFHQAAGACTANCFTRGRIKFYNAEGMDAGNCERHLIRALQLEIVANRVM
jgi:hypothetical protein